MEAKDGKPRRPWWRRCLRGFVVVALVYLSPVFVGCMNLSTPVDYVMNLGSFPHTAKLVAPADGTRRLVVLRHGLWRSAGSLWKMERALRDHGYEVLNQSYPSTSGLIEEHAEAMAGELDDALRESGGQKVEVYFVGHSMGGVQIRSYLSGPEAVKPEACVFIAVPHRGACLIDKRKDWLLFRILIGREAPLQLRIGNSIFSGLKTLRCDCGVIFGGLGDGEGWNDDIPGDDDGTVGVDEAQLPEANDKIRLRLGHTSISFADETVHQVLHYLKHRRFAHPD